jgi:hypothetical protein
MEGSVPRLLIVLALQLLTSIAAHAYDCPKPTQQLTPEVVTEVRGSATTLFSATSDRYDIVARTTSRDLFEKYPNADRIAVMNTMLSMFCQVIMASSMSDDAKLDRLYRLDGWITHTSGQSVPVKLADTTTCPTDADAVLQPIRAVFMSWARLDLASYLAQWAPNGIHRSKYGVWGKPELAQKRRSDFANFSRVDVLSYTPKVAFVDGRKALVNNQYAMHYQRRDGRAFNENEFENYTLECSLADRRWMIRENNDYLPAWVGP